MQNEQVVKSVKPKKIIVISTYKPRKCGIATYVDDLIENISVLTPEIRFDIIAINNSSINYAYPNEVKFQIAEDLLDDYLTGAEYINKSDCDLVILEHEFGIFGGDNGEYILKLIEKLKKPLISCFHSILPSPTENQKKILMEIVKRSDVSISMSKLGEEILTNIYKCPKDKIRMIPHGVFNFPSNKESYFKKRLKIKAGSMIMLSGLLGHGKGFEYVINAMPEILIKNPNVLLYIVGQTHPVLISTEGSKYEDFLHSLVKNLNIKKNVKFINYFLSNDVLQEYFMASDIYITPHLDLQQPTSGTLAKALGAGCVCISTPFLHAKELLADNVGILVPLKDSDSIAKSVNLVLSNDEIQNRFKLNAFFKGKEMSWDKVSNLYLKLFEDLCF